MKTNTDPIVGEVRRNKQRLAAKFGYDLRAMATDIQKRQKHNPNLVSVRDRRKSVS